MFVLFTLFKLTSDERKALTKISMQKTSHNHSPKPVHASDTKEQENQQTTKQRKRRKGCLQEKIGKVVNWVKLAIPSHSEPLWWKKIGKVANWAKWPFQVILSHFDWKRLEKL